MPAMAMLGLLDNAFLARKGGERASRKQRSIEEKESRRWLLGAESASALVEAGAASVTVIEDREGDIYESFALKPAGVEMLVRAAQDRVLADGGRLFAKADGWAGAGRMSVDLPAIPGRKARQAQLSLRFGTVEIARPCRRKRGEAELPKTVTLSFIEAREEGPPQGEEAAHWRLLTTHKVEDIATAQRIVGFYRKRWTIEQLFRTMKTKGYQIEALRQQERPLQKLVTAILIAAITVMQLVAERDAAAGRAPRGRPRSRGHANPRTGLREPRRQNPKTEKSSPQRLARLRRLGFHTARRLDRLLRETRADRHAQRLDRVPRHQTWMETTRCVNLIWQSRGISFTV
jgi:hypothetical protein